MDDKLYQLKLIIEKNELHRINLKSQEFIKTKPTDTTCPKKRYRDKNKEYIKFLNKLYYDPDYQKSYRNDKTKVICHKCCKKFTKFTYEKHSCFLI